MKAVTFNNKQFYGDIQDIISLIKLEYDNMLKLLGHCHGISEEQIDARFE